MSNAITKSGFITWGREIICLLMHVIFAVITLLSFLSLTSHFLFLSYFSFNFLFRLPRLPFMGTVPIYMLNQTHVISSFCPHCSLTIFVCCRHPSKVPITFLAVRVQPPLHSEYVHHFLFLPLPTPWQTLTHSFSCVSLSLSLSPFKW